MPVKEFVSAYQQSLLQLTYIRFVILLAQAIILLFTVRYLSWEHSPWPATSALGLLAVLNLVTYVRLRVALPVTAVELGAQLMADVTIYAFLLYQTGGGTNPFISLLLVPVIISVMTLSTRFSWAIAVGVMLLYALLLRHYVPLPMSDLDARAMLSPHDGQSHLAHDFFNLHTLGMWLNFTLTVIIVTYFILAMNRSIAEHEQALQAQREQSVRDQQILSLATLAAGTAHELNTPLATMRVLLHELSLDSQLDTAVKEDVRLLQQQVDLCSDKLKTMARTVSEEHQNARTVSLIEGVQEVIHDWTLERPEVTYTFEHPPTPAPQLLLTTSLKQALLNLFNNAADANPKEIQIHVNWDEDALWLRIRDFGPGLPMDKMDQLGQPFITTKGGGLGIGLFLTTTTIARYDGDVRLYNASDRHKGTITEVRLNRKEIHEHN